MPRYAYVCECGHQQEEVRSIADRAKSVKCSACGGVAAFDVVASMHPKTDLGYSKPMLSRALGVPSYQIEEAQRMFPHHKFAPDGRMIIESHQEHKRVLKDLGYTEY